MCVYFQLWSFENYTSKFRPHLRHKILCSFSPSPSTYLFLPSSSYPWFPMVVSFSWLIFSLKWRLQSSFFHLHSAAIDLQEEKDSIDEEDPRHTSSTLSYITHGPISLLLIIFLSNYHHMPNNLTARKIILVDKHYHHIQHNLTGRKNCTC